MAKKHRATVEIHLNQLCELGEVWTKASPFDHEHVACTSYVLFASRDGCTWKHSFQLYNGRASEKQVQALLPEHGRLVEDMAREVRKLERAGYLQASPAPTAPEPGKSARARGKTRTTARAGRGGAK